MKYHTGKSKNANQKESFKIAINSTHYDKNKRILRQKSHANLRKACTASIFGELCALSIEQAGYDWLSTGVVSRLA